MGLEASKAPKPSEAPKSAEALRFRPEDVGEVAQNLVNIGRVGLIARTVLIDAGMAELVVASALLIVFEHLIGLTHLNELLLRVLVTLQMRQGGMNRNLVGIGMVLLGQLEIVLLDLRLGGILGNAEDLEMSGKSKEYFVVIALEVGNRGMEGTHVP